MKTAENPGIIDRLKSAGHAGLAVVVAVGTLAIGVGCYKIYEDVRHDLGAFDKVGQALDRLHIGATTPPHGSASIDEPTWRESILDVQCPGVANVYAGVATSDSYSLLGITVSGGKFNHMEDVRYGVCGEGILTVAKTNYSSYGVPLNAEISLASYTPTLVGIDDLSPVACESLKATDTLAQINAAEVKYAQDVKKRKIPGCDEGIGSAAFGATDEQAGDAEALARRLLNIAGYVTPLTPQQESETVTDAEAEITAQYDATHTKVPIYFTVPPVQSAAAQIAKGLEAIAPELYEDFDNKSVRFTMKKVGKNDRELFFDAEAPGGGSGEVAITDATPDQITPKEVNYLNQLARSIVSPAK